MGKMPLSLISSQYFLDRKNTFSALIHQVLPGRIYYGLGTFTLPQGQHIVNHFTNHIYQSHISHVSNNIAMGHNNMDAKSTYMKHLEQKYA